MTNNLTSKKKPLEKATLAKELHRKDLSLFRRYCLKAVGKESLSCLLIYELLTVLFCNLGGGIGFLLRRLFYPRLFNSCGESLILGKGVTLRHPWKISVGSRVAIDNNVMLDASGAGLLGISLGDDSVISCNCTLQGKTGPVSIGSRVIIANNVIISSIDGIIIEEAVLIGGNCYIGGGMYNNERTDIPIMDQGVSSKGAIRIGQGAWLGAGVIVLDGVSVGRGCIIGAGSVVTKDVPEFSVALGVPARVVSRRKE